MSPDLDKKLCETFSLLYADRHKSMRETCMCWGFEFADGWFDIVWRMSERLEGLIQKHIDDSRLQGINLLPENRPRAGQVKEKFGTLRVYLENATEEMWKVVEQAEAESETVCEGCGKLGILRSWGWMRTLCDGCETAWQASRLTSEIKR